MADKSLLEIFKDARALLARPNGWIQGTFARDAAGHRVKPTSPAATCYCELGALLAAGFGARPLPTNHWFNDVIDRMVDENDRPTHTQDKALARFDQMIAQLEAESA